jgi:hypothetical protein
MKLDISYTVRSFARWHGHAPGFLHLARCADLVHRVALWFGLA